MGKRCLVFQFLAILKRISRRVKNNRKLSRFLIILGKNQRRKTEMLNNQRGINYFNSSKCKDKDNYKIIIKCNRIHKKIDLIIIINLKLCQIMNRIGIKISINQQKYILLILFNQMIQILIFLFKKIIQINNNNKRAKIQQKVLKFHRISFINKKQMLICLINKNSLLNKMIFQKKQSK